jgi:hypothetical protein
MPCQRCCSVMKALCAWWASIPKQVRQGVCQRGAATRQGPRTAGPMGSDTLADNIVKLNLRAGGLVQ